MDAWLFKLLLISSTSFVAYSICIAVNNKLNARMIFLTAAFLMLLVTVQGITPIMERFLAKIDSIQDTGNRLANIGQGKWKMPMKGELSQVFKGKDHHGVDIAAPIGRAVEATRKGEVKSVGWSDIYGNVVVVDHGDGLESLYGHLQGISVKVGYPVIAGDNIGTCGNTGNSTGPHLHFEIRRNGVAVDPLPYLN